LLSIVNRGVHKCAENITIFLGVFVYWKVIKWGEIRISSRIRFMVIFFLLVNLLNNTVLKPLSYLPVSFFRHSLPLYSD